MHCISVSHKKAPVTIRERFAFSAEEKEEFVRLLEQEKEITGCVVLCTCNRSEIYISGGRPAVAALQQKVADFKAFPLEELLQYLNIYSGDAAVGHLFKVCCGFDSMVLGEDEILGQVKDAYQTALELKTADYELNVLFQRAITCAKKIKTDTNLSKTPLSIATLVANEVFRFEKTGVKNVLVIGMTGKMGGIITKNILSKPGIMVTGTVRSHRAELQMELKDERVKVIDYRDRYLHMQEADIVVSATTGPHYTVTYEELAAAKADEKPRLYMDVAVPMDMDPEIRKISGLTLYDIDFFETLSHNNNQIKRKELHTARSIMEEELDGAIKEILFHFYLGKLPEWKQELQEKSLDMLLFKIRDHVTSEELKIVLKTLDHLNDWILEG